ncbi:hypothetical protein BH09GEM1_BH09GEM1_22770 [soil metagenome]
MLFLSAAVTLSACSEAATSSLNQAPVVTPTASGSCSPSQTLAAGQVLTGISGTSVCIGGVAESAEYALVAFNSAAASAASFSISATYVAAPSASTSLISSSVGALLADVSSNVANSCASRDFEVALRLRERAVLTPLIPSARTWIRQRAAARAAFDVIPSSITTGQMLRLNANGSDACSSPTYRNGRVVAVTSRAIVVADTLNPTGGFTDAEFAAFGATFDTLVDPVDRGAFGDPSDIDGNGRVVIFFTSTVNDLTPKTSASYVAGFFFSRDLFPTVATPSYDACAGSNMGEMFYVMVPDPSRGGAFTKSRVTTEVIGVLAHEYQHLINASRRMYVNTAAQDFEETWLDEGLAHIAEELLFYKVSGLSPRQDLGVSSIRATTTAVDAFNNYASSNFGRYEDYLKNPTGYSAYADNDSLATRGATWSFLRYAADHAGSTDGTVWHDLVNSTTTGIANLRNVFGSSVVSELRDWGVSVLADDVAGATPAYSQQSWDFRNIYATLDNATVFPIATTTLGSGSQTVTLVRGANAYLQFAIAAGGTGSVQWTSAPAAVEFSLVRIK